MCMRHHRVNVADPTENRGVAHPSEPWWDDGPNRSLSWDTTTLASRWREIHVGGGRQARRVDSDLVIEERVNQGIFAVRLACSVEVNRGTGANGTTQSLPFGLDDVPHVHTLHILHPKVVQEASRGWRGAQQKARRVPRSGSGETTDP
ncbi:hypothetical protein BJY52DRAFT_1225476 [Lactarius psammicola]|nr:hypothetical protein BJY52DRAFT_1225476 [Lactarius psammicola]